MIKKIPVSTVIVGMYIDNLGVGWLSHDFVKSNFLVEDTEILHKLKSSKIQQVLIDTEKGLDVPSDSVPQQPASLQPAAAPAPVPRKVTKTVSSESETNNAKKILLQANTVMKNMMTDIRLGKQVDVEVVDPLADRIMASVERNKDTLTSLARIKTKDDYTFMHSVSVSALMIAFARANDMSEDVIREVAIGGLLHDIGKMITPNEILNKPGKLTDEEFVIMRNHVVESQELLKDRTDLSKNVTDVIFQHHEKIDGTGYPLKLTGDQQSTIGKMSAIVDVYDALTSIRVYKTAWEPCATLKKMMQWTDNHLDKEQMMRFIRCVGIYPVGTLVEMESGRIGIVMDQHEASLMLPVVKFMYKKNSGFQYPKVVDLSKEKNDKIIGAVAPEAYGIDVTKFV